MCLFGLVLDHTNLKELRHDILSHFFEGLSHGLSVGKPKTNGLLIKEKTKGVILKKKGTRIAKDGEDWNGLEMTILKSLAIFFKMHERWRSSFKAGNVSISKQNKGSFAWPDHSQPTLAFMFVDFVLHLVQLCTNTRFSLCKRITL